MVLKEPPQWYLHHPYALILHFFSLSFTLSSITVPPHTHLSLPVSLLTHKSLSSPKAPLHPSVLSRVSAGRLNRALWGGIVAVVIVTSSYRGSEGPRLLFASCSLFSTTHFTAHHDTQQTAHYCKPDTALQHATESKLSGQQALPHKRATPEIKQQTSLLNTVCVGT